MTRKIYEIEQASNVPDDPELTLRPDVKKTLRKETVTYRHHNGSYQLDRTSTKVGKKAWSCCMNKREESDGCVVKRVDKQRWNLDGF